MYVPLKARIALMFFLQYFSFGAWFVPLGTYMSKGMNFDRYIGYAYAGQGVATIVSTLMTGMLADRLLAPEKVLSILFLLTGVTLLVLPHAHSIAPFMLLLFLVFLFFVPTIALTNAVCLQWLEDPGAEFPRLRVFGTLGWISSGVVIGSLRGAAATASPVVLGGVGALLLAFYSLSLPQARAILGTRPKTLWALFGLDVVVRSKDRSLFVLLAAAFLITLSAAFYYAYANNFLLEAGAAVSVLGWKLEATALQSLGQVSELAFLLALPLFLRAFGIKGVFLLGIASWVVRCLLFALGYGPGGSILWMLVLGVLLHGAANDFVQVAGQIYLDEVFGATARSRAQALFTTVIMGFGAVVGSAIANPVYTANTLGPANHRWTVIWMCPGILAMATLGWFWFAFRANRPLPPKRPAGMTAVNSR